MLGLLIMIICSMLQLKFQPFTNELMNKFEFISLCVSLLTFFLGVFTMDSGEAGSALGFASMAAFFLNIAYICVAIPIGLSLRRAGKVRKDIRRAISSHKVTEHKERAVEIELQDVKTTSEDSFVPVPPPEPESDDSDSSGDSSDSCASCWRARCSRHQCGHSPIQPAPPPEEPETESEPDEGISTADNSEYSDSAAEEDDSAGTTKRQMILASKESVESEISESSDSPDPDPDPVTVTSSTEQPAEKKSSVTLVRAKRAWESKKPEQINVLV